MRVSLGLTSAFPEGRVTGVVLVDEREEVFDEVGVLRWEGSFYAIRNWCTHQGGPVCAGRIVPKLVGTHKGDLVTDDEVPILICPWHAWEFDARTGRSICDDKFRLKTLPVYVEDDYAYLELRTRQNVNVTASVDVPDDSDPRGIRP